MTSNSERSYQDYMAKVPEEHLEAHATRIALEQKAIDDPDYMSPQEEEEWTRRFREDSGNTLNS